MAQQCLFVGADVAVVVCAGPNRAGGDGMLASSAEDTKERVGVERQSKIDLDELGQKMARNFNPGMRNPIYPPASLIWSID